MEANSELIKSIVNIALELDTDEQRRSFIVQKCAGDTKLEQQVHEFMEQIQKERTVEGGNDSQCSPLVDRVGTKIGHYHLIEKLGEGGFGEVFYAQQDSPLSRKVALKVIKPGMDSRDVLERFEAEKHSLSLMDHPGITKVFDAGQSDDGYPYFVMELIAGKNITQFCDQNRLSIKERLMLFQKVCAAISHAHQKGLIHRDLKPSNILVEFRQNKPQPKIIDFGIAKVMEASLGRFDVSTAVGMFVGTPIYTSPEQAAIRNDQVDVRSDVYSLGVILHELLVGKPQVTTEELKRDGKLETLERIQNEEFPLASSVFQGTDDQDKVAKDRKSNPRKLFKGIRGELDWILAKATSKDPSERYDSVGSFSRDIGRYLSGDPIQAIPPSQLYRIQKFVMRNRVAVATAVAFLFVLFGATGFSSLMAYDAIQQRNLARTAAGKEEKQRKLAQEATEKAVAASRSTKEALEAEKQRNKELRELRDVMISVFQRPHPQMDGRSYTIAEALKLKLTEIERAFNEDPKTKILLLHTIVATYQGLGLHKEAKPVILQAMKLCNDETDPMESMRTRLKYRLVSYYEFTGELEKAKTIGVEIASELNDSLDPVFRINLFIVLSRIMSNFGNYVEAEMYAKKAINLGQKTTPRSELLANRNYVEVLISLGKIEKAYSLITANMSLAETEFGNSSPLYFRFVEHLCWYYEQKGEVDKAIELFTKMQRIAKSTYGQEHPNYLGINANFIEFLIDSSVESDCVAMSKRLLGLAEAKYGKKNTELHRFQLLYADAICKHRKSDFEEAEKIIRKVLDESTALRGTNDITTMNAAWSMINALRLQDKLDQATKLAEKWIERFDKRYGAKHPSTLMLRGEYCVLLTTAGKLEKAISILENVTKIYIAKFGDRAPGSLWLKMVLGNAYSKKMKFEKAGRLLSDVYQIRQKNCVDKNFKIGEISRVLAQHFLRVGNKQKAVEFAEKSYRHIAQTLGDDHPVSLESLRIYAEILWGAGKKLESIERLKAVVDSFDGKEIGIDRLSVLAFCNLVSYSSKQGALDENYLKKLIEIENRLDAKDIVQLNLKVSSCNSIGEALEAKGRFFDAINAYEKGIQLSEKHNSSFTYDVFVMKSFAGRSYLKIGNTRKAVFYLEQTFSGFQKLLGMDDTRTWKAASELVWALELNKEIRKAEQLHKQLVANLSRLTGEGHRDHLIALENFAMMCKKNENFKLAITLFRSIIEICKKKNLEGSLNNLNAMYQLSEIFTLQGKVTDALALVKDQHKLALTHHPPGSRIRILSFTNLSDMYQRQGKIVDAIRVQKEMLNQLSDTQLRFRNNCAFTIAILYLQVKNAEQSVLFFNKALKGIGKEYKKNPNRIANAYLIAGTKLDDVGFRNQAEPFFEYAYQSTKQIDYDELEQQSPKDKIGRRVFFRVRDNFAWNQRLQKKYARAIDLYSEVLASYEVREGRSSENANEMKYQIACTLIEAKEFKKAESCYDEFLERRENFFKKNKKKERKVVGQIANSFFENGCYEQSIKYFKILFPDDISNSATDWVEFDLLGKYGKAILQRMQGHKEVDESTRRKVLEEVKKKLLDSQHGLVLEFSRIPKEKRVIVEGSYHRLIEYLKIVGDEESHKKWIEKLEKDRQKWKFRN